MKAVVIMSGGMDSTTLLYKVRADGYEPHVLSFFYKQKHKKELKSAEAICKELGVPWQRVDLSDVNKLMKGSSLTDDVEMPKGHYSEDSMAKTVVPSRNTIMLSIASAYAVSIGATDIFFGAHAGDRAQYADCRTEYVEALNEAFKLANTSPVFVYAPFMDMDKGDIAKLGLELGVPFQATWTCYEGKATPCLRCGSCVERVSAFIKAGQPDPLLGRNTWLKAVKIHDEYQKQFDEKMAQA